MLANKERTIKNSWRNLAGAAMLCAALVIGQQGLASAAGNDAPAAQAACTPSAITTGTVNMRTGPGTNNPIITVVPINVFVNITGRNADRSWYQVVFNGQQGWVSAQFLRVSCVQSVPVVTPAPAPTPSP